MMKNFQAPEGSIFRKRGFFIALYSCFGAVIALALVVTFLNRTGDAELYDQPAVYAGADDVSNLDMEAWFRPRPTPEPPPVEPPPPPPPPTPPPRPAPPPTPPTPPVPPTADNEPPDTDVPPPTPPTTPVAQTPPPAPPPPPPEPPVVPTFSPFSEADRMVWPVEGEVVMPFSMDAAIRDNTLQQYRLNNHMRIAAEEGDIVRAGADGRVLQVSYGNRMGHFVVVDHGDGWVATYGQLTPATNVREGDIIRTGQIVGTITQPSIFGYYDGPHLHFMLVHDDEHVNPYHFLAGRD